MTILLETPVPEIGRLSVHIHADVQINVSAVDAQQRVTQFVHRRLSSQMHGEAPLLMLGEQTYWRVPVQLTFPSIGNAGQVGAIDVNVETGELNTPESVIQDIEHHAEDLTRRIAPAARS